MFRLSSRQVLDLLSARNPRGNDLDFAANFLQMCFAVPCEPYIVNPIISRALGAS